MIKFKTLAAVAIGLALVGCKGEEPVKPEEKETATFWLTKPAGAEIWTVDEKVNVFNAEGRKADMSVINFRDEKRTAKLYGTVYKSSAYYALYPADPSAIFSSGKIRVNIPSAQTCSPGTPDPSYKTSIACGKGTTEMVLRDFAAKIEIRVNDPSNLGIRKICFKAGEGKPAGKALAAYGSSKVELNVDEGVSEASVSGTLQAGSVYPLTVYPGTYKGVSIEVTDKLGNTMSYPQSDFTIEERGTRSFSVGIEPQDEKLFAAVVRSTSSTITVAWTMDKANLPHIMTMWPKELAYDPTEDASKDYKVELYTDASCTNMVVGFKLAEYKSSETAEPVRLFSKNYPPRFCFSGLEPATDYYLRIRNITDNVQMVYPLTVSTTARSYTGTVSTKASVGSVILFEDFWKLIWGGDLTSSGAGYSRYDRGDCTSPVKATGDEPYLTDPKFYVASASVEMGLFNTIQKTLSGVGIDKWGWISEDGSANAKTAICARPGYLKMGANSKKGSLVTPELGAIAKDKQAKIRVSFKAAPYGSTMDLDLKEREVAVKLIVASGYDTETREVSVKRIISAKEVSLTSEKPEWKDYSVELEGAISNSRIVICSNRSESGVQSRFNLDDIKVEVLALEDYEPVDSFVEGHIKYNNGSVAAGVAVSDGFSVVKTDASGYYKLAGLSSDTKYIYYCPPSDAKLETADGNVKFYTKYEEGKSVYDFEIKKGTVENKFVMFTFADPQAHYAKRSPQTVSDVSRFGNESVPAINTQIAAQSVPCYGVTLGDIVYSEGSRNSNNGLTQMRTHFSKINMPVFQTMGNHDYTYFSPGANVQPKPGRSTVNLVAQEKFEDCFGPINHSFNRGNVHFICMKDIVYNTSNNWDAADYSGGFTDDQYEWIKQDLACVPTTMKVVLCVHIPLSTSTSGKHVQDVANLIKKYQNPEIFSGHTHYMRNNRDNTLGIYDHIHSAVCGQWWWSKIEGDGCPNGYKVYTFDGTKIVNEYFIGVNEGMNTKDFQIRMYRGNLKAGGSYAYFNWNRGDDVILINVFNAAPDWKVEVYENDVYKGKASLISNKKNSFSKVEKGKTYDIPAASSQDWWAIGYHIGVVGRGTSSTSYYTNCFHVYSYKLTNKSASVKVVATDPYGNSYTCTEVIGNNGSGYVTYPSNIKMP